MNKTEEPSPRRLRKAQEEGDSPLSVFASQSVGFLCAIAIAPSAVVALASRAGADLRAAIVRAAEASPEATIDVAPLASSFLALTVPVVVAAAIAAAATSLVQTGGVIATRKLAPRLDKLNPIAGLGRLLSLERLVATLRAAIFACGVIFIVHGALRAHAVDFARVAGRLPQAASVAGGVALEIVERAAILGVFLAVLDVVVTRRSWRKRLMMTKEEAKREQKESEGDPKLKAARARAHQEMLAGATVANVKDASVVVTDAARVASALRYEEEEGDKAPVVVAAGRGELAARIVEAARQYGVPIVHDVPLARAVVELDVGAAIPESLYEAAAAALREGWEERAAEPS